VRRALNVCETPHRYSPALPVCPRDDRVASRAVAAEAVTPGNTIDKEQRGAGGGFCAVSGKVN
jgi:hypothetical protein